MRSIPQSIQDKINKQNQTIFDNANPKMQVTIARAKNTVMDSTYFTTETIRQKAGLGDISLAPRRFKVTGRPNRIYEIHVDNGVVGTAIREYPDKFKDGWIDQFSLGSGSNVAIAFNGEWHRYRKLWRLVTDEEPWVMWVDGAGKLQTQHWDNVASKQELATGVTLVRALRGWKNVNFTDQDQGIIAAYIKTDGLVYYRNYCDRVDDTPIWENERQLTAFTGIAVSLNLFITNDYRMGFIIEDSLGDIYWYITGRNWAGMAIAPENIKPILKNTKIDYIKINKISTYNSEYISPKIDSNINYFYSMSDNSFREIINFNIIMQNEELEDYQNYGVRLLVTSEHGFSDITLSDFLLKDEDDVEFAITGINQIEGVWSNNKVYEFQTADFNNANGNLALSFKGDSTTKGEAGQIIDSFNLAFTPINLTPTFIPLPEVEVITNE